MYKHNDSDWDLKKLKEFWSNDNFANIKPAIGGEFPEGFDPRKVLKSIYSWCGAHQVTELGCGYGRLTKVFQNSAYRGFDINAGAISKAISILPDYSFQEINSPHELPKGDFIYMYTVCLHMPNHVLIPWLEEMKTKYEYILIAEILGKDWRLVAGQTPVFNRDLEEYKKLLEPFQLSLSVNIPYQRYVNSPFSERVRSTDMAFLLFSKNQNIPKFND